MAAARVADILASLARGGPAAGWPAELVEACRASTGVSGVGLAVMDAEGAGGVLAATEGHAQEMEDLQFALGEGPCTEATRSGRPVLVADLAREGGRRWPAFAHGATSRGVRSSFTFPLRVGAIAIGVLDLYGATRGSLDPAQVSDALAYADAGTAVLLHLQYPPTRGGPAGSAAGTDVTDVLDRHAAVHQATGMVSVQLGVPLAVALARLRAHAFASDRSILETATDVVARRLRFDDSVVGTSVPRRQPPSSPAEEWP
jgi:GAF domain-containing protein